MPAGIHPGGVDDHPPPSFPRCLAGASRTPLRPPGTPQSRSSPLVSSNGNPISHAQSAPLVGKGGGPRSSDCQVTCLESVSACGLKKNLYLMCYLPHKERARRRGPGGLRPGRHTSSQLEASRKHKPLGRHQIQASGRALAQPSQAQPSPAQLLDTTAQLSMYSESE